jgi:REP element-mobilizing transposase RayT
MSRGNGRQCIFLDDRDYREFIYLLGESLQRFDVDCWNYCVMPNHYHLTLQPRDSTLSKAIHQLNGSYAQWWNRRHERVGHVFQGRFKDQIVDRDSYLLNLTRYVAMNPVRAGLATHPGEWQWSSYRATVGVAAPPAFLAVNATLRLFGEGDAREQRSRFSEFVAAEPDEAVVDRIRSSEPILGDRAFRAAIARTSDPGLTPVRPVADPGLTRV